MSDEPTADDVWTTGLEVSCLQEKLGVTDCILKEHEFKADIDTFGIQNIICGPITGTFLGAKKWEFPKYEEVKRLFEKVKKLNRQQLHSNYVKKLLSKD